jgi:tetratricopeptide (TPR) repeat protein
MKPPACLVLFVALFSLPGECATYGELGFNSYARMQYQSALAAYQVGLKQAVRTADKKKEVIYLNNIATVHYMLGRDDSCGHYLQKADEACGAGSPLRLLVELNAHFYRGGGAPAVNKASLKELKGFLSQTEYAGLLVGCGLMRLREGEVQRAARHFRTAQKIYKKNRQSLGAASAGYYSARAAHLLGNHKKALKQIDKVLPGFRAGDHVLGIKRCLKLKVEVLEKLSDPEGAERVRRAIQRM